MNSIESDNDRDDVAEKKQDIAIIEDETGSSANESSQKGAKEESDDDVKKKEHLFSITKHTYETMSTEYELFYWGGNFAGRGEYVRLVLSLSGKTWRDVGREEGSPKVFEYIKSKQPMLVSLNTTCLVSWS